MARVSPIVATPSPGIGSPLIRRVTSPTVTVPKSPTVASPGIARVGSPLVGSPDIARVGSPIVASPTVGSPGIITGGSPTIRRLPRPGDDEKKRRRTPWEEGLISYRSEPTPHAGLESAYLRTPDVARPGTVSIKRLQRIVSGPAPARVTVPKITRGRVQVPVSRWGKPGKGRGGSIPPVLRSFRRMRKK